jgi:hypothetical protein
LVCSIAKGFACENATQYKEGNDYPDHGSQEMGKGLESKILKDAGIKR